MSRALRQLAGLLVVATTGMLTACTGGDGESLSAARKRFLQTDFDRADKDDDGQVSGDERAAEVQADFFAMEITGDGVVTMADVHADAEAHARRPSQPLYDHLGFDTNGDDRIEPGEYDGEVTTRFAPMDGDGDGSYSWEEVRAFHQRLRYRPPSATSTTVRSPFDHPLAAAVLAAVAAASLVFAMRTKDRRRAFTRAGMAVVVVAGLQGLVVTAPAGASALYNDTDRHWDVVFTCGVFCAEVWSAVPGGASRTRPGQAGQYQIVAGDDEYTLAVTGHGWSRLVAEPGTSKMAWSAYDDDGKPTGRVVVERSAP